jgi:hypothetical protein
MDATAGLSLPGSVTLTLSVPGNASTISFSGQVSCLTPVAGTAREVVVGGAVTSSTDPARLPKGSGFAVGLIVTPPNDQISSATGLPAPTAPSDPCSTALFDASHPGVQLNGGDLFRKWRRPESNEPSQRWARSGRPMSAPGSSRVSRSV